MSTLVLGYLLKAGSELAKIAAKIVVLLAAVSILLPILPNDPFQTYIASFALQLRPYTALLNYFFPVKYCVFALAFFIAFKYLIKPIYTFMLTILPESAFWFPNDNNKYT